MTLKKWQLISSQDISPSPWFPLEKRTYKLPNDSIVDDFYVTTIADSIHIIPITTNNHIVMIKMFKQGVDEIMTQFPAGRLESKHKSLLDAAVCELKEEAGISTNPESLIHIGSLALMTTKASEKAHFFIAPNVEFNSNQNLDPNEEIEVLELTTQEIDTMIKEGLIWDAPCIAGYTLAKAKFPDLFN